MAQPHIYVQNGGGGTRTVYILTFGLLLLVGISLWLRASYFRSVLNNSETNPSPLSMAVQELVATAGGVYLAIVALTSFLKLETPDKVTLMQTSVDPLALAAVSLAIIQPVILKVYHKFKSSR